MSILDGSPDMFLGVAGLILTIVIIALLASIVLFIKRRFSPKKQVCPTCGAQINKGKQCPNCSAKNVAFSPKNQPTCPACSASLGPSEKFCHQCGANVEGAVMPREPITPIQLSTPVTNQPDNKPPTGNRSRLLRFISGALILSGLILPFYLKGTMSLGAILLNFSITMDMRQSYPAPLVFLTLTAFMILLGGLLSLTRGIGGALITLVGLLLAALTMNFIFGELLWVTLVGLGFYLPLIGAILNLVAVLLGRRK